MPLADWMKPFFAAEDEAVSRAESYAAEILDVAERPYFVRLREWLQSEADKPVNISENNLEMVRGVVRANAFKEILSHMTAEIKKAEQVVADRSEQ